MNYYGKFKAYVQDTNDPLGMGRIKAVCPMVSRNYTTAWCEPCFPCENDLYIPPVGSCVWIEFCQGDLKKPIWVGGWYSKNEVGNTETRLIRYGGATIELTGGRILLNGVDVLNEIQLLKERM